MLKKVGKKRAAIKRNIVAQDKFYEMLDVEGFWNIKLREAKERLGVPIQTLHDWRHRYIMEHGTPKIEKLAREMNINGYTALKRLAVLSVDQDKNVAVRANKALVDSMEKFAEILERWGLKPREETQETTITIHAKDKDLYKILTATQRKKLANMALGEDK
uniref:Uncharacterized protein n=1 Tax=viral metagenome TaxID=1070528 RepID=A0A6M3JMS3_9ZZZZ